MGRVDLREVPEHVECATVGCRRRANHVSGPDPTWGTHHYQCVLGHITCLAALTSPAYAGPNTNLPDPFVPERR